MVSDDRGLAILIQIWFASRPIGRQRHGKCSVLPNRFQSRLPVSVAGTVTLTDACCPSKFPPRATRQAWQETKTLEPPPKSCFVSGPCILGPLPKGKVYPEDPLSPERQGSGTSKTDGVGLVASLLALRGLRPAQRRGAANLRGVRGKKVATVIPPNSKAEWVRDSGSRRFRGWRAAVTEPSFPAEAFAPDTPVGHSSEHFRQHRRVRP